MPDYINHLNMLPGHMGGAMQRWIENGIHPGGFLTAVLCNDLMGALGKADDMNGRALREYGMFLYNYAPSRCFGSPAKFDAWEKHNGLAGMEQAA